MSTLNGQRQPQPPPPRLYDRGAVLIVAALAAVFFVTAYGVPSVWRREGVGVAETRKATLADADEAARDGHEQLANDILLALAKKNNAQAQLRLGEMYEIGPTSGPPDIKQAAQWYEKAAASGLVEAKAHLGHLYLEGVGILQDFPRAKTLLESAANDGNATAQFDLARMWQNGWGGPEDRRLAYAWYEFAAQQDYRPALRARDKLLSELSPKDVNEAQVLLKKLKGEILESQKVKSAHSEQP
jgi:TPR repeat protein